MSAFASCGHEYTRGYVHVVCAMWRDAIEREEKFSAGAHGGPCLL
jgi:hypothetical protein